MKKAIKIFWGAVFLLLFICLRYQHGIRAWFCPPDFAYEANSYNKIYSVCTPYGILLPEEDFFGDITSGLINLTERWRWSTPDGYSFSTSLNKVNIQHTMDFSCCTKGGWYDYDYFDDVLMEAQDGQETYRSVCIYSQIVEIPGQAARKFYISQFELGQYKYRLKLYDYDEEKLNDIGGNVNEIAYSMIDQFLDAGGTGL